MDISPLMPFSGSVRPDALPLDKLAATDKVAEKEKIQELSRQFEALLLRQIFKEARKNVIKSGLIEESTATDIYNDMINDHLADSISRSGMLGLAESLARELSRQFGQEDPETASNQDTDTETENHRE